MPVEFAGKVRGRDPASSWDAAGQQSEEKLNRVQSTILNLYRRYGPMIDEQLCERYIEHERKDSTIQWATAQSIRSRRHELLVKGFCVDTGNQGRTTLGNSATIYTAREEKAPAELQ
jgi:hypothetical protein